MDLKLAVQPILSYSIIQTSPRRFAFTRRRVSSSAMDAWSIPGVCMSWRISAGDAAKGYRDDRFSPERRPAIDRRDRKFPRARLLRSRDDSRGGRTAARMDGRTLFRHLGTMARRQS